MQDITVEQADKRYMIGVRFVGIVVALGVSLYQALVLMIMYNWFAQPTFDLPTLSYGISIALILTLDTIRLKPAHSSLIHYEGKNVDKRYSALLQILQSAAMVALLSMILVVGWVIRLILA